MIYAISPFLHPKQILPSAAEVIFPGPFELSCGYRPGHKSSCHGGQNVHVTGQLADQSLVPGQLSQRSRKVTGSMASCARGDIADIVSAVVSSRSTAILRTIQVLVE